MPTKTHQLIVMFLIEALKAFVGAGGVVLPAGYPLRIPGAKYRETDVIYLNVARPPGAAAVCP